MHADEHIDRRLSRLVPRPLYMYPVFSVLRPSASVYYCQRKPKKLTGVGLRIVTSTTTGEILVQLQERCGTQ